MSRVYPAAALVLSAALGAAAGGAQEPAWAPRVDRIARSLVDADLTTGLVVAVVRRGETHIRGFGVVAPGEERTPDADTVYEIGSITKVFTGILLADAVERGLVDVRDPLAAHLPAGVEAPARGAEPIRLVHLTTHTSGLPRVARSIGGDDPYAGYSVEDLYAELPELTLLTEPGQRFAYSNLATGLLGQVLADLQDTTYSALLVARILDPLGMPDTRTTPTEDMGSRLAPARTADGRATSSWSFDALAGCGALRSTGRDVLRFVQANLAAAEPRDGEPACAAALRRAQQRLHAFERGGGVAFGWHIEPDGKTRWHNGATGGYHCFLAVEPDREIAAAVLSNTTSGAVDAIGRALMGVLRGREVEPPRFDLPAEVPRAELAGHAGSYRFASGDLVEITLDGEGLSARLRGRPRQRLLPRTGTRFYARALANSIVFDVGRDGVTRAVTFRTDAGQERAERVE